MDIIQLISAFGFGAIVATIVQAWYSQRAYILQRNFSEKKECYIGLLEAYREACLKADVLAKNKFAYWSIRCSLVAPQNIRALIEEMKTDDSEAQKQAFEKLQSAMRSDLGVQSK